MLKLPRAVSGDVNSFSDNLKPFSIMTVKVGKTENKWIPKI